MDIFNGFNIPVWPTSAVVLQVTFSSLGIFLNFMLLYAHKKDPCKLLRSSSSPFIVNIAVIDFLASCTILANQLAHFSLNVFTFTRPVIIPILHMVILFLQSTSFAFVFVSVSRTIFFGGISTVASCPDNNSCYSILASCNVALPVNV